MIIVSFALAAESREFERAAKQFRNVRVLHTGVGEKAARAAADKLLAGDTPDLWISSGFAGALDDTLGIGDLFFATNYSTAPVPAGFSIRSGGMTSAAAVLDTAADRARLCRSTGADTVDMETKFIAEACTARAIPLLAIRAISDTPTAPFPAPPDVLFDIERQRTSYARLLFYLARNPATLPRLVTFGRQIGVARRSLTSGLLRLLELLPKT
jgi:purine-nucleoside phosphorylase